MHDAKGRELTVGDRIFIPCTIEEVYSSPEFCNCKVVSEYTMPGSKPPYDRLTVSAINTKQILRANDGDEN